jgi:protein-S-isoprenylcysteine O-methyltransferase Ste14
MNLKQKLVSPILMWVIIFAGAYILFQILPARFVYPRNMFTSFLIFPAAAYWLYFFTGAARVHRQAALSADRIDRIVRTGVYGRVRHPIYSADIVMSSSIFLFYPDLRVLLSVIWLTLVMLYWMYLEEKALTLKYPEYAEYRKTVPKIFPWLGSK